jgi:hypothetical protein
VNTKKTVRSAATPADTAANSINTETRKLHEALIAQVQAMSEQLGNITDPDVAEALLREMQEVNFRVMIAGSLLFKQTTAAIDANIGGVVAANDSLKKSLDHLTRINDIVRATTKFLGLVDTVLDAIKLL